MLMDDILIRFSCGLPHAKKSLTQSDKFVLEPRHVDLLTYGEDV